MCPQTDIIAFFGVILGIVSVPRRDKRVRRHENIAVYDDAYDLFQYPVGLDMSADLLLG